MSIARFTSLRAYTGITSRWLISRILWRGHYCLAGSETYLDRCLRRDESRRCRLRVCATLYRNDFALAAFGYYFMAAQAGLQFFHVDINNRCDV
jgi:hypothetical protein